MNAWQTIAVATLSYLLGSVSFAWILAKKIAGVDLRTVGSGNLGATNAGRLLGRKWAIVIYLLDFSKGFVPVIVLRRAFGDPSGPATVPVSIVAGLAAFLGHCLPIWHGFRGGKGVATASGVITALTPRAAALVFLIFGLAVALSRRISVGSVAGAAALPLVHFLLRENSATNELAASWTLALYGVLAIVVIFRHRQNLRRLVRGEEPRIGARKP
jgi:acyl phosphate:glycerol-3-phosphate acyltransferase